MIVAVDVVVGQWWHTVVASLSAGMLGFDVCEVAADACCSFLSWLVLVVRRKLCLMSVDYAFGSVVLVMR